ncbi:hypothetical protein V8C26DRAFT_417181 [Trichoderma gracile]
MQPHGRNLWASTAHFCSVFGKSLTFDTSWHAYSLAVLQGFTVSLGSRWDVLHDLRLLACPLVSPLAGEKTPRVVIKTNQKERKSDGWMFWLDGFLRDGWSQSPCCHTDPSWRAENSSSEKLLRPWLNLFFFYLAAGVANQAAQASKKLRV